MGFYGKSSPYWVKATSSADFVRSHMRAFIYLILANGWVLIDKTHAINSR